jgi:hypothetical protein
VPVTWRSREVERLYGGTYTAPIWSNEAWWQNRPQHLRDQFAHVSQESPGAIAFTDPADDAKAERDIQIRMRAGKYLKKFFGDVLTPKQIAFFAEWQTRGSKPALDIFKGLPLKFATSAADIEEVYANGPHSCMSGDDYVRVYASGDLAIAYLENSDGDAPGPGVVARALVWPENKAVSRIYPSIENWGTDGFSSSDESEAAGLELLTRLKALGYRTRDEDSRIFDGARVVAEPWPNSSGAYVMPYIDSLCFDNEGQPYEDGFFRLTAYGSHAMRSEDGEYYAPGYGSCDYCDERIATEDDAHMIFQATDREGEPDDARTYCASCANPDAGRVFICDGTGEAFANGVGCVDMANGEVWNTRYFEANGFRCAHDYNRYPLAEESTVFPGYWRGYDSDPSIHPELQQTLPLEGGEDVSEAA